MSVADVLVPPTGIHTVQEATRVELSQKAATFHYQHYRFNGEGKAELEKSELRPQPLGAVIYPLIEWAHQ